MRAADRKLLRLSKELAQRVIEQSEPIGYENMMALFHVLATAYMYPSFDMLATIPKEQPVELYKEAVRAEIIKAKAGIVKEPLSGDITADEATGRIITIENIVNEAVSVPEALSRIQEGITGGSIRLH